MFNCTSVRVLPMVLLLLLAVVIYSDGRCVSNILITNQRYQVEVFQENETKGGLVQ